MSPKLAWKTIAHSASETLGLAPEYNIRLTQLYTSL